jgi:dTDP-4-amino-4,6-dideoxygalactose transaminase
MKNNSLPAYEGGKPVRNNFLIFGSPKIGNREIAEVVDSLKSGWLSTGPKVARFESGVKDYIGSSYSLALNSCTAGLHLALLAYGVGKGDEVITSPLTFAATANVIEHVGAKPVFADVELDTMNIDPKEIEKKISKKTKAIIPVHLAGRPCNLDAIIKIASRNKLKIIDDAAHAFGASYHGKKIGNISDATAFSFYVTKNLVTGEGGMLTTNNKRIAETVELYALHGMSHGAWKRYSDEGFKHYLIQLPGYKYNMMDIQAAIGIHQLERFDKDQKKREGIWKFYDKKLNSLPLQIPGEVEPNTTHSRHLYTILVALEKLKVNRDFILNALKAENIGSGVHFIALHLHPYYKKKYGYRKGSFPIAEYISARTISLPLSAKLTKEDVQDVVNAVSKVMNYYSENKPSSRKHTLKSIIND